MNNLRNNKENSYAGNTDCRDFNSVVDWFLWLGQAGEKRRQMGRRKSRPYPVGDCPDLASCEILAVIYVSKHDTLTSVIKS